MDKQCERCGRAFEYVRKTGSMPKRFFCSRACKNRCAAPGYDRDGYRMVYRNGQQVSEHRAVWEEAHGPIPKGYHVHHVNGDKVDNRICNLSLVLAGRHVQGHMAEADPEYRPIDLDRALTMRQKAMGFDEIGREFGVSGVAVRSAMLKAGLDISKPKLWQVHQARAIELRAKGYQYREIGEELGIDATTAFRAVKGSRNPRAREKRAAPPGVRYAPEYPPRRACRQS